MPATGQEWIFISYRRKGCRDEAHALAARLRERIHHGAVFLDEPGIDLGDDFDQRLRQAVSSALVVIVVIGKGWPQTFADRARDLRPPQVDYVRLELAAALERARRQPPQCVLIPWLVGGATMPTDAELAAAGAAELGDLARRQAGSGDFAHAPLSPGDPTERLLERIDRAAAELLGDHRLSRAHAQDAVHALLRGFEADPGLKGIASLFNEQGVADMLRDSPSDAIARLGYIAQKAVPRSAKAIQRQHLRRFLAEHGEERRITLHAENEAAVRGTQTVNHVVVGDAVLARGSQGLKLIHQGDEKVLRLAHRLRLVEAHHRVRVEEQLDVGVDIAALRLEGLRHGGAEDAALVHIGDVNRVGQVGAEDLRDVRVREESKHDLQRADDVHLQHRAPVVRH
mgnify:CR=1 FL=1